jgi:hypothetical protein
MWPGEQQHNGGEQNPQGAPPPNPPGPYNPQAPYGTPSPYAQPGYQQQPGQPERPDLQKAPEYPPTQPYGQPAAPAPPSGPPPAGPPPPPYAQAPTQPYGQPGYGTPSPYQQPGYPPQQPPGGYPTPQNWGPPVPGGPGGQPPRRDRKGMTVGIAITAAVAVIAAIVVGAVYLTGDDKKDKDTDAKDRRPTATASKTPTATATATPSASSAPPNGDDSSDSPRGAPDSLDVKPVVPGWKVVTRSERNVAFDVPQDWTIDSEGMTIGFSDDKGNPAVAMGAPAYYKHNWCTHGSSTADRATVGTKGANGAKSVRDAAEGQATAWAYWAYQENGKGTFSKVRNSKAFHNSHGISGWQASATASNIPKTNRCSADGAAYTVAWTDPTQSDPSKRLVVWVLYADRGVPDQLADSVIEKIKSTIRPLKK